MIQGNEFFHIVRSFVSDRCRCNIGCKLSFGASFNDALGIEIKCEHQQQPRDDHNVDQSHVTILIFVEGPDFFANRFVHVSPLLLGRLIVDAHSPIL